MKYFQQSVDFDYSWEEVSTSNWQKYGPWNEKTPHVIAVDTLSRTVDPDTGIVRVPSNLEPPAPPPTPSLTLPRCAPNASSPANNPRPSG